MHLDFILVWHSWDIAWLLSSSLSVNFCRDQRDLIVNHVSCLFNVLLVKCPFAWHAAIWFACFVLLYNTMVHIIRQALLGGIHGVKLRNVLGNWKKRSLKDKFEWYFSFTHLHILTTVECLNHSIQKKKLQISLSTVHHFHWRKRILDAVRQSDENLSKHSEALTLLRLG